MESQLVDILTPQGYLSEIQKDPNLDVVMNLFKIPRAFAVSGFGNWNVGQHSVCVAFLALYWAKFRGYDNNRRNQLMVLALTHDLHEAATGDILPGLKNIQLKNRLEDIQQEFLSALHVEEDNNLKADIKVLDIIAFMYEIQQALTINLEQKNRLQKFFIEQKNVLKNYCENNNLENIELFLDELGIFKRV